MQCFNIDMSVKCAVFLTVKGKPVVADAHKVGQFYPFQLEPLVLVKHECCEL